MINKVHLIGNLGRDPETRHTQAGDPVCSFSIATTKRWKDKNGDQQEKTEWHNITAWRGLAEVCAQYLQKGSQVYIEGELETQSWEKDGEKKYRTHIIAREMKMLGKKREGVTQQEAPPPQGGDFSDDIPFARPHAPW